MQLFVVRHGQTEWNKIGRKQGHGDSPLTALGESQAHEIGRALKSKLDLDKGLEIVSSPLGRAKATAKIVTDVLGLNSESIRYEPLLKEGSFGAWEGSDDLTIRRDYPDQWQQRESNKWDYRIPDGESHVDLCIRAQQFFDSLSGASVKLVITHQMMSRCLQHVYSNGQQETSLKIFHPQNVFFEYCDSKIKKHTLT